MTENNYPNGANPQDPNYAANQQPHQPVQPQGQYQQPQQPYPPQGQYQQPQQPYPPQGQYQQPQQPYPPQGQYQQPQQPYPPQGQYQQPYPAVKADNTKLYSVLSYFGILWLIGLLADKTNPRVRFHVNQGILLCIYEVAIGIVYAILTAILTAIFGVSYFGYTVVSSSGLVIIGILGFLVWASILALAIVGIVNAAKGQEKPLPVIGKLFTIVK